MLKANKRRSRSTSVVTSPLLVHCPLCLLSCLPPSRDTSTSPLCLTLQPSARKENGKTTNPAASDDIRVYQPIMPLSDLFGCLDLSLCACLPPHQLHTFPLSSNKGDGCCNINPPPRSTTPHTIVTVVSMERERKRERWLSMPPPLHSIIQD